MPVKISYPDHVQILGQGTVALANTTATALTNGFDVGKIVEEIALLSKSHAIIERVPKTVGLTTAELAMSDFDSAVQRLLKDYRIKCMLMISSKAGPGISISAVESEPPTRDLVELIRSAFAIDFDVNLVPPKIASAPDISKDFKTHEILLEVGMEELGSRKDALVAVTADVVGLINGKFGFSERHESPSDSLD